jgi:glycosyltransferase involved in cell wall biosynthesis
VELFNEIAAERMVRFQVAYLYSSDPARQWSPAVIRHDALTLDGDPAKLAKFCEVTNQSDLVVFNYYNDPFARRLIRQRVLTRQPWVFWGERPGFRAGSWTGSLLRRWKLRRLHFSKAQIWGIGNFAVERYRKEFGTSRVYQDIPYYSDLTRFQTKISGPRSDSEGIKFLFSGSLIYRKGVDLLGRAFARAAREFPNARLTIMGGGPLRDDLHRLMTSVASQVEFVGFKDWHQLPSIYQNADVLCVPSRHDGWGLVVPEGLASGLPVIGTDRTGAALEFIETGRNGWLIPAGDGETLFDAMHEAARLPRAKLSKLSADARATVKDHSLHHGAERFIAACREAVANWTN